MKTILVSVEDADYEIVQTEAARRHRSLTELFRDYILTLRGASQARPSSTRRQWLEKLREARATHGAQRAATSSTQEILDELRRD